MLSPITLLRLQLLADDFFIFALSPFFFAAIFIDTLRFRYFADADAFIFAIFAF